jgi:hypothetical protein
MRDLQLSRLHRRPVRQGGQAIAESILACSLLAALLFGVTWVWKFGELKQYNTEAVRFAAWERTAYQSNAGDELKTIYASDKELAEQTFRYVYMTPQGRRASEDEGNAAVRDHQDWMTTAARFFNGRIDSVLNVKTDSSGVPGNAPNGFEPTGNTLTSLELDDTPYDKVSLTGTLFLGDFFASFARRFGIVPPIAHPGNGAQVVTRKLGSLSLITNSWAAPGTVALRRVYKDLNPLSTKNYLGHYVVNNPTAFNLSQFFGGQSGMAGNYRVDMIGVNAGQANTLLNNGLAGNVSRDAGDWLALLQPTNAYMETMTVAPEGAARFDPDYAGLTCATRVPEPERLQNYRQDARCPVGTMRARTISLDNPAWRFSTTAK